MPEAFICAHRNFILGSSLSDLTRFRFILDSFQPRDSCPSGNNKPQQANPRKIMHTHTALISLGISHNYLLDLPVLAWSRRDLSYDDVLGASWVSDPPFYNPRGTDAVYVSLFSSNCQRPPNGACESPAGDKRRGHRAPELTLLVASAGSVGAGSAGSVGGCNPPRPC